ncbi:hypothetical protein D9M68_580380 [compost metagenome]
MNAIAKSALPAIGTALEGGYYAGLLTLQGETYALIVSPKAQGELEEAKWGEYGQDLAGARSYNDGLANTQAMAEAGSDLARWMLGLEISGFTDWYLPSRDELEVVYRNLKPTSADNYGWRAGENPSSVPPSHPYTADTPKQTQVQAFADGGAEAFEEAWYWASTQSSPYVAWIQHFDGGDQDYGRKALETRARAVRRFRVTP